MKSLAKRDDDSRAPLSVFEARNRIVVVGAEQQDRNGGDDDAVVSITALEFPGEPARPAPGSSPKPMCHLMVANFQVGNFMIDVNGGAILVGDGVVNVDHRAPELRNAVW